MFRFVRPVGVVFNNNKIIIRTIKKADIKVHWNKPQRLSRLDPRISGDIASFPEFDKNLIAKEFENSKELETADDTVRRLFTLGFLPQRYLREYYEEVLISEVRRHKYDENSIEVQIARLTAQIRYKQMCNERQPFPEKSRLVNLSVTLIKKRKQLLGYLRTIDYPRYEWVLEKLDLIYKANPEPDLVFNLRRKESLRRLADEYCENIKKERLDAYREVLESQQVAFLADKIEKLIFVRQEQLDLEIPVTISDADIEAARKQYDIVNQKREVVVKARGDTGAKWQMY